MTTTPDLEAGPGELRFAKDYVGADYHNDGHTHIDAFCHVIYDGSLFHSRWPFEAFGTGPQDGRLILVAFFTPKTHS